MPPARLVSVRRIALLGVVLMGLGLFGAGVRGLSQIDGDLAAAAKDPAIHQVKQKIDVRRDCPWRERLSERRL